MVYTASLGAEGRWSFVSAQVERMLGWTTEEWLADPRIWIEQIHPDDRERVLEDEEQLLGPGDQLRSEYRMLTRDRAGALGPRRRQRHRGRERRAAAPGTDARRDRPEAGRAGDARQRAQVPPARGDLARPDLGDGHGRPLHVRERRRAHDPRLRARGDDRAPLHGLPDAAHGGARPAAGVQHRRRAGLPAVRDRASPQGRQHRGSERELRRAPQFGRRAASAAWAPLAM